MFHICLTYVSHMFDICFTYVLHMFHIYFTYVPYMFHICSTYVPYMFHICCHSRCLCNVWCRSTYVCSKSHLGTLREYSFWILITNKPSILGYHYFWKHPYYLPIFLAIYLHSYQLSFCDPTWHGVENIYSPGGEESHTYRNGTAESSWKSPPKKHFLPKCTMAFWLPCEIFTLLTNDKFWVATWNRNYKICRYQHCRGPKK